MWGRGFRERPAAGPARVGGGVRRGGCVWRDPPRAGAATSSVWTSPPPLVEFLGLQLQLGARLLALARRLFLGALSRG